MDYSIKYLDNKEVEITYDDNTVIKGKYEIIGFYNVSCSIWVWGYASLIERDYVGLSEKIKNLDLDSLDEEDRYYAENESFFISYNTIDSLTDFIKRITKVETIACNIIKKNNVIEYIVVKNNSMIKKIEK